MKSIDPGNIYAIIRLQMDAYDPIVYDSKVFVFTSKESRDTAYKKLVEQKTTFDYICTDKLQLNSYILPKPVYRVSYALANDSWTEQLLYTVDVEKVTSEPVSGIRSCDLGFHGTALTVTDVSLDNAKTRIRAKLDELLTPWKDHHNSVSTLDFIWVGHPFPTAVHRRFFKDGELAQVYNHVLYLAKIKGGESKAVVHRATPTELCQQPVDFCSMWTAITNTACSG